MRFGFIIENVISKSIINGDKVNVCYFMQSIGQAYEDVQNKNQHLLQQVTERDDYNIKVEVKSFLFSILNMYMKSVVLLLQLAVECVKARQAQHALEIDIDNSKRAVQQGSISLDIYGQKSTKLDDLVWFHDFHLMLIIFFIVFSFI